MLCLSFVYFDPLELRQGALAGLSNKVSSAQRTGRVVIFPGRDAHLVEIFLALRTVLKSLVFFVHFGEANCAVSVVFEVDVLGIFLVFALQTAF